MHNFKIFILLMSFLIWPISSEAQVINKVIAVVNDEIITQQDVDQLLAVLYAQYVQTYKGEELLEKMEEVKKDILKQMIEDRLILSHAKELNIEVTELEIDEKLNLIKNGFPSEKDFYEMLEAQGITIADLKKRYKDQIMMKKLVDWEIRTSVGVLPSEITAYYEENRPQFKQGERYKVMHILIKAEDDVSFELAKVEMARIYNSLKKGDDFSELAKEFSQGPNKNEGGDMGYIEPADMREELGEAIIGLKTGDFSEPIKSDMGYHIFKVEDIKHSGYLTIEDVQKDIKMMLFQKKFRKRLKEWLIGLRKDAYISIK